MAGNGWKWLEMASKCWKGVANTGKHREWLEKAGIAKHGWKWLDIARIARITGNC